MKLNINKLADEVIASLKEEKSGSKTVWDELTSQVSQDGTWDQELIDKIEKYAHLKLKPHKENDVRALWESKTIARMLISCYLTYPAIVISNCRRTRAKICDVKITRRIGAT